MPSRRLGLPRRARPARDSADRFGESRDACPHGPTDRSLQRDQRIASSARAAVASSLAARQRRHIWRSGSDIITGRIPSTGSANTRETSSSEEKLDSRYSSRATIRRPAPSPAAAPVKTASGDGDASMPTVRGRITHHRRRSSRRATSAGRYVVPGSTRPPQPRGCARWLTGDRLRSPARDGAGPRHNRELHSRPGRAGTSRAEALRHSSGTVATQASRGPGVTGGIP
jgi:hypothetical protein